MINLNSRRFLVVVGTTVDGNPVYLGAFDGSLRNTCGVQRIENAIRYTRIGAARVARGFRDGRVIEVSF